MKVDALVVGAAVRWGRGGWSGTVIGWAAGRPDGERRSRNDRVRIRRSGAPEFCDIWAKNGEFDKLVPVKALRASRKVDGGNGQRIEKSKATADGLLSEIHARVDPLRAVPGRTLPSTATAKVECGGRRIVLTLSAQDATGLLHALKLSREALLAAEWGGLRAEFMDGDCWPVCPVCCGEKAGHAADCKLGLSVRAGARQ